MAEAQALPKQAERATEAALANHAKRIAVNDWMSHIALRINHSDFRMIYPRMTFLYIFS